MTDLDTWVSAATRELGLQDDVDVELLLDVARDVAHGVHRTAAPITTYLLGVAVGRGAEPTQAAAVVRQALAGVSGA
jgi:hypothetical protein